MRQADKVTLTQLIQKKIDDSEKTLAEIAKQAKMSRSTLYRKLLGKAEFTTTELDLLGKALNIPAWQLLKDAQPKTKKAS